MTHIDNLEETLQAEQNVGILNSITEPHIREAIRRELILRLQGKKASLVAELENDPQVSEAAILLKEPQRYTQHLVSAGSKEHKGN